MLNYVSKNIDIDVVNQLLLGIDDIFTYEDFLYNLAVLQTLAKLDLISLSVFCELKRDLMLKSNQLHLI